MPREDYIDRQSLVENISDITTDIMNDYLGNKTDEHNGEVRDCYNDVGGAHGYYDGYYELDAKMDGTFVEPSNYLNDYNEAQDLCGSLWDAPKEIDIPTPTFWSPPLVALEIILTPTELGDGTLKNTIDVTAQDYQTSYDAGHSAGMSQAFDDRLEERFTVDFSNPVATYPAPIDAPAAGLDYVAPESGAFDTNPSWSSGGGYDGGTYGGGGDTTGGGGSSDGGSSNSD